MNVRIIIIDSHRWGGGGWGLGCCAGGWVAAWGCCSSGSSVSGATHQAHVAGRLVCADSTTIRLPRRRRPICHLNNLDSEEDSVFVFLDEAEVRSSGPAAAACLQAGSSAAACLQAGSRSFILAAVLPPCVYQYLGRKMSCSARSAPVSTQPVLIACPAVQRLNFMHVHEPVVAVPGCRTPSRTTFRSTLGTRRAAGRIAMARTTRQPSSE